MHTFEEQTKTVFSRLTKTIVLIRKLGGSLPKPSLPITLNKSFVRPHDINYDQSYINLFQKKIETAQYNTGFAITSAIRGKLEERPYKELGFKSIQHCQWHTKICYFCRIAVNKRLGYLAK